MQTSHPVKSALALLLTLGLGFGMKAQNQAVDQNGAPSGTIAAAEEPVVLNAFTVNTSTDVGYVAVNSLAGGRNNTPLAVTPTSVVALTSAFMGDLQLTNAADALKWTMNAVPANFAPNVGSGNEFNSWAIDLRGAGAGPQGGTPPTVNYFEFYAVKDFFNVDRFELSLGPNSILFGVGNLGGVAAYYTKKPMFDKSFEELDVQFTSFGGARAVLDVNQLATLWHPNDLGVRVDLLADRDETWRKEDEIKSYGAAVATTFKISEKATVRFDVEVYQTNIPQYAENISDEYSQWNGQTASATWGAAPAGPSTSYQSMAEWGGPSSFQLWIPSEGSLMNWGAGYRGTGLADGPFYTNTVLRPNSYTLLNPGYWPAGTGTETVPALPSRDFTVGPKDGTDQLDYYTLTAYFDQEITRNLDLEISAYRFSDREESKNFESPTNVSVDINKQLPNGMPNPEFGQLYSDMFLDKQIQDHSVNEVRGSVMWHFDTTLWGIPIKESLNLFGGETFHLLLTREYNGSFSNYPDPWNGSDWTEDMIWAREYWNAPNTPINLPNTWDGHSIVYQALPFNWFDHDLQETTQYAGLLDQTRFWDDRLAITLGARRDDYNSKLLESVRPPFGLPYPQGYEFETATGNTYSAGVVGYFLKNLAAVYNFSENFAPIGGGVSPSLYGAAFGPATGKGQTAGLRYSTNDGKYYITANYYEDKAHGRVSNDSIGIQGIWNDYYKAGGTATDIGPAGVLTGTAPNLQTEFNYADTEDVKDSGYEVSAVGNPTPNIRFQLNWSIPKSVEDNDLPNSRAYFAQHLTEWQAVASGGSTLDGTVAEDLRNAETTLANTSISATNQGTVKYTFNAIVAYTWTDGFLKGLGIGGGGTALGAQESSTGGAFFSPSYTTYVAFIKYEQNYHAMGRHIHLSYQLNVDNLTNNQNLVFTGYNSNSTTGGIQGSNFYYIEPRKFTGSISMKF
jgi:hypothetical protein